MGFRMSMGGWRYVAASVIGTSHEKAGGACQDANDCQIYALPAGEKVLAAAVADGAGSAVCGGGCGGRACRSVDRTSELHSRLHHVGRLRLQKTAKVLVNNI